MIKVLFGGCFDPLHYGHILALKEIKKFGYLIVIVASDERERLKKGSNRPIIPAEERVKIIKELRDVDQVVCLKGYDGFPNILLLDTLKPNIAVLEEGHPDMDRMQEACKIRNIGLIKLPRLYSKSRLSSSEIIKKL